ncbi:MarC family protein [Chroococcidiopsis sp. TS-821]|uniref:MarC family protein n=1 Tax=Chroococcidiopsis sp. TS-821 TaxID=1378066 RepID=UPI000CED944D|nr:MarC family protein [Chroococcidiopsis sp. TS-821]PPS46061.1 MarC family transcriptional regulator [Chroococcidiopsis sp. TS-821]
MTSFIVRAFLTLFVVLDPIGLVPLFMTLAGYHSHKVQLRIIRQALLVAGGILFVFALFGNNLLRYLGISVAAFQVAAGILLLKIAIDMVFAQRERETKAEESEAQIRTDISVFPLGTPLIAGPGALASILILQAEAAIYPLGTVVILGIIAFVLLLIYGSLAIAQHITHWLGRTGINVISRVLGILLAALAVQYIVDGILTSIDVKF